MKKVLFDSKDIERTLIRIAHSIIEKNRDTEKLCLVGIQRGGVYLANRLAKIIREIDGKDVPVGALDIALYRDDLNILKKYPEVRKTDIPVEVTGYVVVLVDDVLFTGRSIRAAKDALMDIGRPAKIELAVLIDRGHRELPIKADFIGKNIPTSLEENIEVELVEKDNQDRVVLYSVEKLEREVGLLEIKDLLGIKELSPEDIMLILNTAKGFRDVLLRDIKKVPTLRGKTVVNLFFEPSTRTSTSFELAAKRLSTDVLKLSIPASSVVKGETLIDTAMTIQALGADFVIIRHSSSGAPHLLARHLLASVINAGDGTNEHPTQALLDAFTIKEIKGGIEGLKVAIIGDILHSRVAKSDIYCLKKLGADIRLIGPPTLIPDHIRDQGLEVFYNIEEGLSDVDVIMMLRIQMERQDSGFFPTIDEYFRLYGLTKERLSVAKKDAIVMHPGPMNRGVEIASEVADSPRSVILEQVTNGIAVRMAVLYLLAGSDI